jgi:hypothetical protein
VDVKINNHYLIYNEFNKIIKEKLFYELNEGLYVFIKIKIKDEELFREKYEQYKEKYCWGVPLNYLDIEDEYFKDCIEVNYGNLDWDDVYENEFDLVMDKYLNENNID